MLSPSPITNITQLNGTPKTVPTAGQLYIGKSDGTFALATLTQGANVTITNGDGTVTIASVAPSGLSGAVLLSNGSNGFVTTDASIVSEFGLTTLRLGSSAESGPANIGQVILGNGSAGGTSSITPAPTPFGQQADFALPLQAASAGLVLCSSDNAGNTAWMAALPSNSGDWATALPTTIQAAFNRIAALLNTLSGAPIP